MKKIAFLLLLSIYVSVNYAQVVEEIIEIQTPEEKSNELTNLSKKINELKLSKIDQEIKANQLVEELSKLYAEIDREKSKLLSDYEKEKLKLENKFSEKKSNLQVELNNINDFIRLRNKEINDLENLRILIKQKSELLTEKNILEKNK